MNTSELMILKNNVMAAADDFTRVQSVTMNFQKEANFAIQAMQKNDYLATVAIKNPQSIKNAVINVAAIGISLNPALKLAYLVPRKGEVCLDISYMGLAQLATDSGSVSWVQAEIVRKKDKFKFNGPGKLPTHTFDPFSSDRGDVIGTYCVAKTLGGDYLVCLMSKEECLAIRDRTESYQKFKAGTIKSCPWSTDENEMIKKTCIRRAYKLWPKSERLAKAEELLNEDGIDFEKEQRGEQDVVLASESRVDELINALDKDETRIKKMLDYFTTKDKRVVNSLEELSVEQVNDALKMLSNSKKKEEVKNENA